MLWPFARPVAGRTGVHPALLLALACALPAQAGPADAGLTPDERKVVALVRLSDAHDAYWTRHVRRVVIAAEDFRRAALLRRCERVRRHAAPFLEPALREAIEQVAANRQRETERFAGATMTRWQHRSALHALAQMPRADADRLLAGVGTPAFDRVLALLAHEAVLSDFQSKAVEVSTGRYEPASVIWLKAYFERAGNAATLRRAVASTRPDLADDFDRVGSFERHSPADAEGLGRLAQELMNAAPAIAREIAGTLPAEFAPADALLRDYFDRVIEAQGEAMPPLSFGRPAAPRAEAEADAITKRFPPPDGLMDALVRIGPTDVAGAEVERFCPR